MEMVHELQMPLRFLVENYVAAPESLKRARSLLAPFTKAVQQQSGNEQSSISLQEDGDDADSDQDLQPLLEEVFEPAEKLPPRSLVLIYRARNLEKSGSQDWQKQFERRITNEMLQPERSSRCDPIRTPKTERKRWEKSTNWKITLRGSLIRFGGS
ncbi:unnamed protein product [Amoebophrya sp. A25]|nr:unnamed protein product [Amoebophrya sp. A25]|eukprot:GSA25T00021685001.1